MQPAERFVRQIATASRSTSRQEADALIECEVRDAAGKVLLPDGREMRGFFERMRGMSGMTEVDEGFAMVFRRCGRIQCKSMRIPIDVAHLDGAGRVLQVGTVEPGEMGPKVPGCRTCVEMRAGRAAELGIAPGSALSIIERPRRAEAGAACRQVEMPAGRF